MQSPFNGFFHLSLKMIIFYKAVLKLDVDFWHSAFYKSTGRDGRLVLLNGKELVCITYLLRL